jgi:hypothetical protein
MEARVQHLFKLKVQSGSMSEATMHQNSINSLRQTMAAKFSDAAQACGFTASSAKPKINEETVVTDAYIASVVNDWTRADDRIAKLQVKSSTSLDKCQAGTIRKCIEALQKSIQDKLATLSPRDEQRCRELHAAGLSSVSGSAHVDSEAIKAAADAGDFAEVDRLLDGYVVPIGGGDSAALKELQLAGGKTSLQGAKALIKWEYVAPPGNDFTGDRPWVPLRLTKGHAKWVLLPNYFVLNKSMLESHRLMSSNFDSITAKTDGTGVAAQLASMFKDIGSHSELKKHKGKITSVEIWYEATILLNDYATETTPPLLPATSINKHNKYCLWMKKLLLSHHADSSAEVLNAGIQFDESFRLHLARKYSPEEMDWDATAFLPAYEDFKNSLEKKQYNVVKTLKDKIVSMAAKLDRLEKLYLNSKKTTQTKDTKEKKDTTKRQSFEEKLLTLKSPSGKKANKEFLKLDGKLACWQFNSPSGCSKVNCKFSHHCPATGVKDKSITTDSSD